MDIVVKLAAWIGLGAGLGTGVALLASPMIPGRAMERVVDLTQVAILGILAGRVLGWW